MDAQTAGKHVALYWLGAMVGRFIGAAVLRVVRPNLVLAFNAAVVIGLLVISIMIGGKAAMWPLLAIGLFNSIMFPTIFTLAIDKLGKDTGEGSGVLCVAIVGGALVPPIQALFADHIGILLSFFVPALCYAYIVFYGLKGYVVKTANA
jgi:FHS family L-fucose permease-like MFS transporter